MSAAPADPASDTCHQMDAEQDAARTSMINDLLQNGYPRMVFPPELEREYLRTGLAGKRTHRLKSGFISLLIFNVFLVADYLLLPDMFTEALILRLLVFTPVALFFVRMLQKAKPHASPLVTPFGLEAFAMVSGLVAAAVLAYLLIKSSSPLAYLHHIGFMVVITYGNIVQRLRFWHAVLFSVILLAMHIVGVYLLPSFPERMVLPIVSMVIASAAFTLTANYALENDERRRFLLTERERGLIRSLTQTQVRLRELSRVDELTGLYNRRHFEESVQQLWQRASFGGTTMAILMIDVDHFGVSSFSVQ